MANWVADFLLRNPDKAALPIAMRAKHSIHFRRPDGQIEAHFTGAPQHYLDTDGLWKPLDTKLIAIGSEYGAPGLRTRLSRNGLVRIEGGIYSHRSTRIGILNPTTKVFSAIKTIPNGAISGDQIIAESGVWKRVLTMTETGLREEIVISALPTGIGAGSGDWLVLETVVSGMSFADGWLDEFSTAGFKFPPPHAFDANRNDAPCKRYARAVSGVQYLYTGIPVSWLASAAYPVTVDPDYLDSTGDGHIWGMDPVYATARSTAYAFRTDLSRGYVGRYISGSYYYIYRYFLKFDTSTIGADKTVTQVNQRAVVWSNSSTTDFDVQIVKQDWSVQDPIAAGNQEAAYDNCLAGTADENIWINTNGISVNVQYASGNLNTGWVNKVGSTYYSWRSSRDYNNDALTGLEYIYIYTQNHATVAYRPVLTVLYTTGPLIPVVAYYYDRLRKN
jgi:hypothetical protein